MDTKQTNAGSSGGLLKLLLAPFRVIGLIYDHVIGDECYLCEEAQDAAGNSSARCPCCAGYK